MNLTHTILETREDVRRARAAGKRIGFVPTMGALHEGHITLVRNAREECDFVVVSVFVNPTQFGPTEDLDKYPRTLTEDARKCRLAGVDVLFAPPTEEMYPDGFNTWVEVKGPLTMVLEGESRPTHYRGVTTICAKLFGIADPDCAYFGAKDYQQLQVIKRMVQDLNMRLEIRGVETVREPDGLAMSSRNAYLNPEERKAALVLSKSLQWARQAVESGEQDACAVQVAVENLIKAERLAHIDYVAIADAETLQPVERIEKPAALLLAVRIGATRLIDNTILG